MLILLVPGLRAMTLDEAVDRAAQVGPDALIAAAQAQADRMAAGEAWAGLTLTPTLSGGTRIAGNATTTNWTLSVSTGALDLAAWMDALEQSADARGSGHDAEAAALDARYTAAVLYVAVLAADAAVAAAAQGEAVATATEAAAAARVKAGLESELVGRSARLGVLAARADAEQARANAEVARLSLARALELEPASLELSPAPLVPTAELRVADAPVVAAARARRDAARLAHWQRIADLLPTGSLSASTQLDPMAWGLSVGLTWSFDGVLGPFFREREARTEEKIAAIELDRTLRDLETAVAAALAQARAAAVVAEVAREREALAEDALKVGRARLEAGLGTALELLRLQDDATEARSDRVTAELDAATSALWARQQAGAPWQTGG